MDKDDKKKMGSEQQKVYKDVRKIFQKKNDESNKLAHEVEAILNGKEAPGNEGESRDEGRRDDKGSDRDRKDR